MPAPALTEAATSSDSGEPGQPERVVTASPLLSRALMLVFLASLGGGTSFYLLLTVVPLYASQFAGGVGAGLTTGALMFSTVVAELITPRLVARFGERLAFGAGLLLLGAPALALPASSSLAAILAVCLVRGLGFGITVVVGSAMVASLVPPERRGEGLGLYGVMVGVPSVVALPLGVWLVGQIGYPAVFGLGAAAALVSLAATPGLPGREPTPESSVGVLTGLRMPALIRPAIVFSATTMAAGIVVTFLALAVPSASEGLVAIALLVQAATSTVARFWAGRYGDRHGSARLVLPAVLTAALGILALVFTTSTVAVMGGMVLFGAGFGVTQNASLTLMFDRVSRSGYSAVSALWNLAYDAGMGVGAAVFGLVAAGTGYAAAFLLTGLVMLAALAPARSDMSGAASAGRET
jgi:MFS family permease